MRTRCPSTFIAKFLSTFTAHCTATIISLNPIFALRTLLILRPLHKLDEILIIFIESIIDPIFSTGHPVMILASALQTVVFTTGRALIVVEHFVEFKGSLAASSWTPRQRTCIVFYILIESKFLKFLLQISIDEAIDIANLYCLFAFLHRTEQQNFICLNLGLQKAINTLRMENVSAFQYAYVVFLYIAAANLAFPALRIRLLSPSLQLFLLLFQKVPQSQFIFMIFFQKLILISPFFNNIIFIDHDLLGIIHQGINKFINLFFL